MSWSPVPFLAPTNRRPAKRAFKVLPQPFFLPNEKRKSNIVIFPEFSVESFGDRLWFARHLNVRWLKKPLPVLHIINCVSKHGSFPQTIPLALIVFLFPHKWRFSANWVIKSGGGTRDKNRNRGPLLVSCCLQKGSNYTVSFETELFFGKGGATAWIAGREKFE